MTLRPLKKVMYVEDDPDIQTIARLALEKIGGFEVRICNSGEEALRNVDEFKPDVILLDVMMPGMGGLAALKALQDLPEAQHIPAILMTAKVRPEEIAHYKSLGAIWVIMKPFDPMNLSGIIQNIWDRKPVTQGSP